MPWFFYATLTPFFYSITNFIDKYLIEKRVKNPVLLTIITGFTTFLLSFLILFFKNLESLDLLQIASLVVAGLLLDFYLLPYFKALKLGDASRIVPLFQVIPVFVILLSFLFLGESLNLKQIFGFILILSSGFILSAEKLDLGILKPNKTFILMIISSLMYALVIILFRAVVRVEDFWTGLYWEYIGMGLGAFALLLFYGINNIFIEVHNLRPVVGVLMINEGVVISAQLSEAFALSLAPAALVNIVGGVQPVFVLLIGLGLSLWFPKIIKEDISKKALGLKLFTILLILLGLFLIYF